MNRTEQRQHLNLSQHARGVMESDIAALDPGASLSGFINKVVLNSMEGSRASISLAKRDYRRKLERDLLSARHGTGTGGRRAQRPARRGAVLDEGEQRLLEGLAESFATALAAEMNSFPKGKGLKVRLRNEVYDLLYPQSGEAWPEHEHYRSQGAYLKALVEDYARQSFYQREAILCKNILDALESELELPGEQRRVLTIEQAAGAETRVFDIKPYKLLADANTNYHYLVCLSKDAREPGAPNRIASFRVSRIARVRTRPKSYGSGKIPAAKAREIEAALEDRGVQYLVGDSSEVVVRLSPRGLALYGNILHMRPAAVSMTAEEGATVAVFCCTELQAGNYFFRFGADAEILSPGTLREKFRDGYAEALFAYDGSPLV